MKHTDLTTSEDRTERAFLLLVLTAIALILMAFTAISL
jgi:hypothetical protein